MKIDLKKKANQDKARESLEYQSRHVWGHFPPGFPAIHFFPFKGAPETNTIQLQI